MHFILAQWVIDMTFGDTDEDTAYGSARMVFWTGEAWNGTIDAAQRYSVDSFYTITEGQQPIGTFRVYLRPRKDAP
jgi:hypothetical protein